MTDVPAARQRAEEILALQPGSKGWNVKLADAARDLARDVVALADSVEAAERTFFNLRAYADYEYVADAELTRRAVAAEARAASLEKAARRVVDCWEVFRVGSVGWGPIYEPLVALRAALSSSASPDTEAPLLPDKEK